ncbi:hypothetical protein B0H63DRAFT_481405 [Podospora didyma]|uniref:RNase MRP protein 1 RNA binding domain-containing protein n=1 Tax=Podospora didyma TaxID=330526 RepID=A0AAE0KEY8_9PEZI|nr:hypothetical protein B0H63DRAFT_481405 [Podospora didyma]
MAGKDRQPRRPGNSAAADSRQLPPAPAEEEEAAAAAEKGPLDTLRQTVESLGPALEILERFHHRNKNQHRLSKWWAETDMLRRHVRKTLAVADQRLEKMAKEAARRGVKPPNKKRIKKGVVEEDKDEKYLKARAGFLRMILVPRAYLSFSQLISDRQFAHLGLMLLGILAQVDKALSPFASTSSLDDEEQDHLRSVPSQLASVDNPSHPQPGHLPETHQVKDIDMPDIAEDIGVAVSREDLLVSTRGNAPSPPSSLPSRGSNNNPPPKKEKEPNNTIITTTDTTTKKDEEPPVAEKRKKKKGGDEFDDIFGSLEEDKPRKKKKKKKAGGGDEFDDIFGGL